MHPQCLVLPPAIQITSACLHPGYLELRVCMSHVYVCKPASFGVAASKTALLTYKLNIAPPRKADGGVRSLIHHAAPLKS